MRRLVSLGDSFSCGEGVGLRYRSEQIWVRQLAGVLGLDLRQLARPGATLAQVQHDQLPTALAAGPGGVATLFAGPNDLFRAGYDPVALHRQCTAIGAALAATFDLVLIARWHDPLQLYPVPGRLRRRVRERVGELNEAVDAAVAAARAGGGRVAVVDLAGEPELGERSAWAIDRVHPSARGHTLIAGAAVRAVAGHGWAPGGLPTPLIGPTAGSAGPAFGSAFAAGSAFGPAAGSAFGPNGGAVDGSPAGRADPSGERTDLAGEDEDLSWRAECRWWARHGGPWMVRRLAQRALVDAPPPPVVGPSGARVTDRSAPPFPTGTTPRVPDRTASPTPDRTAPPTVTELVAQSAPAWPSPNGSRSG